jgi:hypothetical protein
MISTSSARSLREIPMIEPGTIVMTKQTGTILFVVVSKAEPIPIEH